MAKGRMLNREIGMSMKLQSLKDDTARLFATWTISHLDKNGVFYGDPQSARSAVFPMREDVTNAQVAGYLADMERVGLIERFEGGGRVWQAWPGFAHNQSYLRKDLENTAFPAPPQNSDDPANGLRKSSVMNDGKVPPNRREEKGREGNVIEGKGSADAPPAQPKRKVSGFAVVHTEHADERVSAYMDILAQKQITESNAETILANVTLDGLHVWRNVLTTWATNCWKPTNFAGLFERYDAEMNSLRVKAATPAPNYQNGAYKNAAPDKLAEALRMISAKEGNHA